MKQRENVILDGKLLEFIDQQISCGNAMLRVKNTFKQAYPYYFHDLHDGIKKLPTFTLILDGILSSLTLARRFSPWIVCELWNWSYTTSLDGCRATQECFSLLLQHLIMYNISKSPVVHLPVSILWPWECNSVWNMSTFCFWNVLEYKNIGVWLAHHEAWLWLCCWSKATSTRQDIKFNKLLHHIMDQEIETCRCLIYWDHTKRFHTKVA